MTYITLKKFESSKFIPAIHSKPIPPKKSSVTKQPQILKNKKRTRTFIQNHHHQNDIIAEHLDNIIVGICHSVPKANQNQRRLTIKPSKLKYLLTVKKVSVRHIQGHIGVGEVQAKRYFSAYKAATVHIKRLYKSLK